VDTEEVETRDLELVPETYLQDLQDTEVFEAELLNEALHWAQRCRENLLYNEEPVPEAIEETEAILLSEKSPSAENRDGDISPQKRVKTVNQR